MSFETVGQGHSTLIGSSALAYFLYLSAVKSVTDIMACSESASQRQESLKGKFLASGWYCVSEIGEIDDSTDFMSNNH